MLTTRRACNRCHSQKLRCTRYSYDSYSSCARCARAGLPCVFGIPLPMGRPSNAERRTRSRRTDTDDAIASSSSRKRGRKTYASSASTTSATSSQLDHVSYGEATDGGHRPPTVPSIQPASSPSPNTSPSERGISPYFPSQSPEIEPDPLFDFLDAQSSFNHGLDLDSPPLCETGSRRVPYASPRSGDENARHQRSLPKTSSSNSYSFPILDIANPSPRAQYTLPGTDVWGATEPNRTNVAKASPLVDPDWFSFLPEVRLLDKELCQETLPAAGHGGADFMVSNKRAISSTQERPLTTLQDHPLSPAPYVNQLSHTWTTEVDTTETCIEELSGLNVRLYRIYKISCSYVTTQAGQPGNLLSVAAFDSAVALLGGSGIETVHDECKALHDFFPASKKIVDILHLISNDPRSPPAENIGPMHTPVSSSSWNEKDDHLGVTSRRGSISAQYTSTSTGSSNTQIQRESSTATDDGSSSPCGRSLDKVTQHLVLACYERLLQIYHLLASSLHYDISPSVSLAQHTQEVPFSTLFTSELRIRLLVHLILHLLDHLHQATRVYFSLFKAREAGTDDLTTDNHSYLRSEVSTDFMGLGELAKLEDSVRKELHHLQQSLKNYEHL